MTIIKNLMEKPSFFIMDLERSYEVLLRHKYFCDVHTYESERTAPLKIFEISTEIHFLS